MRVHSRGPTTSRPTKESSRSRYEIASECRLSGSDKSGTSATRDCTVVTATSSDTRSPPRIKSDNETRALAMPAFSCFFSFFLIHRRCDAEKPAAVARGETSARDNGISIGNLLYNNLELPEGKRGALGSARGLGI